MFLNVPGNRFFRTISNSNFKLTRDCSKRTNFTPFSLGSTLVVKSQSVLL